MDATRQRRRRRRYVNLANFAISSLFVIAGIAYCDGNGGGGGFATKISKITENLDRAVLTLSNSVNYTDYNASAAYFSDAQFKAKGMAGLYNLTTMFMDWITPDDILMKGMDDAIIHRPNKINFNVSEVLKYYWAILAIVVLLVLLAVLLPLCGLCFCFCRCCGNCGARSQPADKRKDLCAKIFQGALLIGLATALLFCVVCAFGSNQQMQDGIDGFSGNLRNSVTDTNTFLDHTMNHTKYLLVNNYREFVEVFNDTMNNSSVIVMEELEQYSNATNMLKLKQFIDNMSTINGSLITLRDNTNSLRVFASQLNDALRKVKRDLLNTLVSCKNTIRECTEIYNNISRLETNIDFNKLPDVSPEINKLSNFDLTDYRKAADQGMSQLDNIKTNIQNHLKEGVQQASRKISDTSTIIDDRLSEIRSTVDSIKRQIDSSANPAINTVHDYIYEYGQYRYYGGLAVCCTLLLVTICIALGLVCGICGKRPDGYSDNCCNKGAGSQFLICAVMIMFFFGCFISVLALVMFLAGIISEKGICDSLKNPDPQHSRVMNVIDHYTKIEDDNMEGNTKLSEVLKNCYQNKSLYQTFNLNFDLEKLKTDFNISEYLNKLNLSKALNGDFQILSNDSEAQLRNLASLNLDVDLEKFKDELKENFTNFSLENLSGQLQSIINNLDDSKATLKSDLQLSVLHINTYNEKLLIPMKSMANSVVDSATVLKNDLTMGYSNFADAINGLIDEIDSAQKYLKYNGSQTLNEIAESFIGTVGNQVSSYINRVTEQVEYKIGKCGPLNVAINSTVTAACDRVLLPWNGFWFSLFWSVVLYIITIIVSVKLANLYQKYKPYGHYVETRGGKRGKKKNKKGKRYEDRPPNVGGEVVAREYTTGTHPPDSRYGDMAPKMTGLRDNNIKSTKF